MRITIEAVEPNNIRCEQCGDWRWENEFKTDESVLSVYINNKLPFNSQLLVAFHEVVEALLCRRDGITDEQVTNWDIQFENERAAGMHKLYDEDGDDPRACYHNQHNSATAVEMMMCYLLGMTWQQHSDAVESIL